MHNCFSYKTAVLLHNGSQKIVVVLVLLLLPLNQLCSLNYLLYCQLFLLYQLPQQPSPWEQMHSLLLTRSPPTPLIFYPLLMPTNNRRAPHLWLTATSKHPICCTPLFILGKLMWSVVIFWRLHDRYIEGLRQSKQHMSNWDSSQSIQQQGMTHVQPNLQTNTWVSSKAAPNNKNLVDALYQLRDYLLQDTAKLSKYLSTTK